VRVLPDQFESRLSRRSYNAPFQGRLELHIEHPASLPEVQSSKARKRPDRIRQTERPFALTSEEARIPANPPNPKKRYGDLKPNLALIPGSASVHMALGLEDGADKYGPFNWRDDPVEAMVYIAACKRHIDEWMDGEDCARDSGAHHLGHAIASLAILIDAMECGTLIDNRPTPGAVSDLIEEVAAQRECAEDQEWVEYKSDNLREPDMQPDMELRLAGRRSRQLSRGNPCDRRGRESGPA
jgi:hypothetical protein